jgi:hypothetical protein
MERRCTCEGLSIAQLGGFTAQLDELVECAHDASGWQVCVDLDPQHLTVEVVHHVERAEPAARPQCIRHEVG